MRLSYPLSRRRFVAVAGAVGVGFLGPGLLRGDGLIDRLSTGPDLGIPKDLFRLGVASGDPLPDRVMLWTRLALRPTEGGGMPLRDFPLLWEVAEDERFARVVSRGMTTATPRYAHTVHVDATGLRPDAEYFYRFRIGTQSSPVGRTRTAPDPAARPRRLRFATASCQHWEEGYYVAHRALAAEDVDFVLFLGDYIYEGAARTGAPRRHEGVGETVTLAQYRNRYAHYRTDADLQAAHASAPWIVTWDDHEVDNNWAADEPQRNDVQTHAEFQARRIAAARAYWEHMPLRARPPVGTALQLYRRLRFGRLATVHVLDTRQFRSPEPTNLWDANDPDGTMTGEAQERWLFDGLARSGAGWNLLANQVMMASTGRPPRKGWAGVDSWDGYRAQRRRWMEYFGSGAVRNPVVLSGDQHATWVCDLKTNFDVEGSPVVGTEITGTSITSGGDSDLARFHRDHDPLLAAHPHWRYIDDRRGYVLCDLDAERLEARLRVADTVVDPGGSVYTAASFTVESDRPGVEIDSIAPAAP